MEYHSAIKGDGILSHTTALMNAKDTVLSKRSPSQKGKDHMSPGGVKLRNKRWNGSNGVGEGDGEFMFNGVRVLVWEDVKLMEMMGMMAVQQCGHA